MSRRPSNNEPMLDLFIYETEQLLEQLEHCVVSDGSLGQCLNRATVDEVFRIMHTIKGSAAMMALGNVANLAHVAEDVFAWIRDNEAATYDSAAIVDMLLEGLDFIRAETEKLKQGGEADGDSSQLIVKARAVCGALTGVRETPPASAQTSATFMEESKPDQAAAGSRQYSIVLRFDDGCEMENIRAFGVVHNLKEHGTVLSHVPEDLMAGDSAVEKIRADGFAVTFASDMEGEDLRALLEETLFLAALELQELPDAAQMRESEQEARGDSSAEAATMQKAERALSKTRQSMTAISTAKLDMLVDLVGELVISESMVTQNPDLSGLELDNFKKAARHHRKIIKELQDLSMGLRMVSLSSTFNKMLRVVRDASQKSGKEIRLDIRGENTELDKHMVEALADPLMHLVRNAIDHGIEPQSERLAVNKSAAGNLTLEAQSLGGDVLVTVRDDGKGLNKERILAKAVDKGLIAPDAELTDQEIYGLICRPGFSTADIVTELSGRGVGLDVVRGNVTEMGGSLSINSTPGAGTAFTIKLPLTLAIVDGMTVRVGGDKYTIPLDDIIQCFELDPEKLMSDVNGAEALMVRGECVPVIRVRPSQDPTKGGIMILVQKHGSQACVLVDSIIGEQQVVVKGLPGLIKQVKGIAGCTLLGDGSISLIMDVGELMTKGGHLNEGGR